MASIEIAKFGCVKARETRRGSRFKPDLYRIEFPDSSIEYLRPLADRRKKIIKRGHRAIVQIRWCGPNAVKRSHLIGDRRLYTVWPIAVHLLADIGRYKWILAIIPLVDHLFDQSAKCWPK